MAADHPAEIAGHSLCEHGRTRFLGHLELAATDGSQRADIGKIGQGDGAAVDNRPVAIGNHNLATLADIDGFDQAGFTTFIYMLRRNHQRFAIQPNNTTPLGCDDIAGNIQQEGAITGIGDIALDSACRGKHAKAADGHIQRAIGNFQRALLVILAARLFGQRPEPDL